MKQAAADTSLDDQIVQLLRRIVRAIDVHSRALSREYELTWPQLAALCELERLKKCTIGQLAAEMYVGAPTVSGIVERLKRDGLVQRFREEADRRKVLVGLTQKGEKLLARKPSLLNEQLRHGLSQLSERQQKQMHSTLNRLVQMMESTQDSAADAAESER